MEGVSDLTESIGLEEDTNQLDLLNSCVLIRAIHAYAGSTKEPGNRNPSRRDIFGAEDSAPGCWSTHKKFRALAVLARSLGESEQLRYLITQESPAPGRFDPIF